MSSSRPPPWAHDARARPDEGAAPPSLVLETGALIARKYRLRHPAGFGGMAQLWVATNEATGAEVCVKILVPADGNDASVQRFRREAHAAAGLSHRAIVRIFDLLEIDASGEVTASGRPAALAIVMELLRGETLGDVLLKKGKFSLDVTLDITLPFLSALAHAHRAGVVHRDLKPDNIFLSTDPDGHVIPKVLDFGVSKMASAGTEKRLSSAPLTLDGVVLGTPSFMSPEQACGSRTIDARSDVFSAGIVVYMMLAGENPFEREHFHAVIAAILQREVKRLTDVPEPVWRVIEKALAKNKDERYADATELGDALRRASGRTPTVDSGAHASSTESQRFLSTIRPLGGDSIVTVPPVGNVEITGADPLARTRLVSRRRPMRVVSLVVVAAGLLLAVSLARPMDPARGWTNASATSSGAASVSTHDVASTPAGTLVLGVAATDAGRAMGLASVATSPEIAKGAPSPGIATDAGAREIASTRPARPKALRGGKKGAGTEAAAGAGPTAGAAGASPAQRAADPKESSIVRDPGF